MPQVSIILLSYNNGAYIGPCLDAVMAQTYKDFEVVAVDNASSDDSEAAFRRYPVKVIQAGWNSGGCEGINIGIRAATGRYILLLNIDTRMRPDALEKLVGHLERNPGLAAAQAKLLIRKSGRLNSAGNAMNVLGHAWCVGLGEEDRGQYRSRPLTSLSGAAFFVRKEALDRVGLYDSEMFLYCEDVDLSLRLQLHGYDLGYAEDAVIDHDYSVSVNTRTKYFYLERNRWVLLLKNFEARTLIAFLPLLIFQELGILAFAARHGLLLEKCRGYLWVLRQLGPTLRKRRLIQAGRVRRDKDILPRLERRFGYADIQNRAVTGILNPAIRLYSGIALRLLGVAR